VLASALCAAALAPQTQAQDKASTPTPGFNHKIPEKIMTPDKVETSIGTMSFSDGMPDAATVKKAYDNLDLIRAQEVFLNGMPAASLEALRIGQAEAGATASNQVVIMDQLLDANPLWLTGNTDTVYASVFLDLHKDGPTVVEIPPKCGPGTVNDAYFRFVIDMGGPGPDAGKGGKYLILPPDYTGELAGPVGGKEQELNGQKYFVAKSTSYVNWVILRGFLVDGKTDGAVTMFKSGFKVYPLAKAANPPAMEFISGSKVSRNTIHANNSEFYEELHTVLEREPTSMWEPELLGQFSSIGIQKGKPFAPDARMTKILADGVAIGNATARAILFNPRMDGLYYYPNSHWYTAFAGGDYQWLRDGGNGGRNQEARTMFFYLATVNTPAMAMKRPGVGSQYAVGTFDKDGNYLDGAKNYTLHIPANVPAKDFWSVVLYDPQTRSELQTSQPFPSKNNKRDKLIENTDGSVDLYYGPKSPAGKEANWTQTVAGKNWFVLFRLYGPLEPWFDKTWRPGEFELVK
jgi:hypothetical protein